VASSLSLARRFWLAYLALAGLFGAAVGTFIVLEERPAPTPTPPWSEWKPTAGNPGAAQQQIAEHVGGRYRLPSGKKLVDVLAGQPGPASDPIRTVAVARTLDPKAPSDLRARVDSSQTAMYILCGDVKTCAIEPTPAHAAALRREALELALYTFRYIDEANSVATFIGLSRVLFVTKPEFSRQLQSPLRVTLPQANAPTPGTVSPIENETVDSLTAKRLFDYRVEHEPTSGARVLLLAPPAGG
jgi:hypothetical protein